MARPRADVTDTELAVLKVLWDEGPATIREITGRLYPSGGASSYATVQKLLERLEDKRWVSRRPAGRANRFRARHGREALLERRLRDTAEKLCEGSLTPLLTHLVTASPLSGREIASLRDLVDRLDESQEES